MTSHRRTQFGYLQLITATSGLE